MCAACVAKRSSQACLHRGSEGLQHPAISVCMEIVFNNVIHNDGDEMRRGRLTSSFSVAYSADINIAERSETLVRCRYSCPRMSIKATFAASAGETEQIVPESLNVEQHLRCRGVLCFVATSHILLTGPQQQNWCCHIKEKTYFYLELHRNV